MIHFSSRLIALKIGAAGAHGQHELRIYNHLPAAENRHVVQLLDSFELTGPNGTHTVLAQEVLGPLKHIGHLTVRQPRELCRQIVRGVAFLHSHGVIHGGLAT